MLASIAYLFVFPHLNIVIPFNCCNGVEPGRLELCPVRAVAAKFALPAMSAYCACPTRIALHGGVRWSGRSWRGRSMNKGGSEAWKKLRQLQQKLVSKSNSRACVHQVFVAFVFSFSISPATFQSSAGTAGSNNWYQSQGGSVLLRLRQPAVVAGVEEAEVVRAPGDEEEDG